MGTLNGNTLSLVIPFNEAVNVPVATNDLTVYIYKEDGTVVNIIKVGKVVKTNLGLAPDIPRRPRDSRLCGYH